MVISTTFPDLIDGATLSDELHDGIPCVASGLDERGEPVGAYLDGTCSVTDESVDVCSTVDLDDVSDLEGQLVSDSGSVMCCNVVDTDVTGECEFASVLPDVVLDLLCDVKVAYTFGDHRESEIPGLGRDPACLTKFLKLLRIKHREHPRSVSW